jgi:hypothetical protein
MTAQKKFTVISVDLQSSDSSEYEYIENKESEPSFVSSIQYPADGQELLYEGSDIMVRSTMPLLHYFVVTYNLP